MGHQPRGHVVIVTGLSGAGKSTALNALEDLGYYCIDNLPPPVFFSTLDALEAGGYAKVAVCMDVRGRAYLESLRQLVSELASRTGDDAEVLYLDAPEELLARRFSATRRPHPLGQGEGGVRAVMDGIRLERELLSGLRGVSTAVLDTGELTVHELRREVIKLVASRERTGGRMLVRLLSFGFKYGSPRDADLMFDVRFLPNPFFVPELKPMSGRNPAVSEYVLNAEGARGFMDRALELLLYCVPRFEEEGKSYVTIAIGCTGGRHRSVALTEWLGAELAKQVELEVDVVHRDIGQAEHGAHDEGLEMKGSR